MSRSFVSRGPERFGSSGLSENPGLSGSRVRRASETCGSWARAPERFGSGKNVDARADVYSLACVLYECLTGRLPFTGENYRAVLHGLLNTEPEPVSRYRADVPATVHRILARALTKDRELRYASADLMLSDLRLYNPDRFAQAVRDGRVLQVFQAELARGRELVDERFPELPSRQALLARALKEGLRGYLAVTGSDKRTE